MFPYAELRSVIQYNHVRVTGSSKESLQQVANGHGLAFVQDDSETYFRSQRHCGISELNSDLPIKHARLIFSKNSTLLPDVNRVISENQMKILQISRKYLEVLKDMHKPTCKKSHTAIGN